MTEAPPRVFISYSHDSAEHRDRVLELADRLRADGIDAMIDQYVQSPSEGWPGWCREQIDRAAFVLMICTEIYLRRVDHKEEPGVGHGVLWEGRLIYQYLYNSGSVSSKFVPMLFTEGRFEHVPVPVQGGTIYRVDTEEDYESLLRLLTEQPLTPMPALGPRRSLPPKERRSAGPPLMGGLSGKSFAASKVQGPARSSSSWPGSTRPPTPFDARGEDVDTRDKPAQDN